MEKYQCTYCNGIFDKCWTDEEAIKESKNLFGDVSRENLAVVCDECFKNLSKKWVTLAAQTSS